MSFRIVPFSPAHAPQLRKIYLASRLNTFTWMNPSKFALEDFDKATAEETILTALENEVPVGFVSWNMPDNFIHSLFIQPDRLRQGFGKQLMEACLASIGRPAALKCLKDNASAMKFYRTHGWEIVAEGLSTDGPYFLFHYR